MANLPDDWVCDCTQNQLTLREAAASMRQSTQLARAGFTFEERRREGSTYFGREAHMLKHAELHNGGPRLVPRLGRTMNQFEATAPTCLFHHHETYPSYIENPQMPPESYQDFIPPSGYHQPPKPEALPERSRPQPLGKPLGVMSPSLEEAIVEVAEGENNITESPLDFTSQTPVKPEVEVEYTVFIPEEEVENKTNEITSCKNTSKKKQKKLFDEEVETGKIRNQNTQLRKKDYVYVGEKITYEFGPGRQVSQPDLANRRVVDDRKAKSFYRTKWGHMKAATAHNASLPLQAAFKGMKSRVYVKGTLKMRLKAALKIQAGATGKLTRTAVCDANGVANIKELHNLQDLQPLPSEEAAAMRARNEGERAELRNRKTMERRAKRREIRRALCEEIAKLGFDPNDVMQALDMTSGDRDAALKVLDERRQRLERQEGHHARVLRDWQSADSARMYSMRVYSEQFMGSASPASKKLMSIATG